MSSSDPYVKKQKVVRLVLSLIVAVVWGVLLVKKGA